MQSRKPCQIFGGVIIRAVYSADLFSIVLRGPAGDSTRDDLTLRLADVRSKTINRPIDPPPHALRLFDPDAESSVVSEAPAPCPIARETAERIIAKADVQAAIPVTGPGWLERLEPGAVVDGYLWFFRRGDFRSLSAELLQRGMVTSIDGTAENFRAA